VAESACGELFSGSIIMKSLGFSVAALALMATSGTAFAAGESGKITSTTRTVTSAPQTTALPAVQSAAERSTWSGALNAPGGLSSYRSPVRGFVLPPYWTQPNFYIEDFARYGFAAPQDDFGWSRYFEDAVLTDSTGRVVDVVKDVDWKRFDNGQFANNAGTSFENGDFDRGRSDPRDFDRERDRKRGRVGSAIGSIGGALIGGAVGAVAGNLIAGKGERLAGSLIGGGVGALAGLAVGEATRGGKGRRHSGRDRYGHRGPHWNNGGRYYPGGYYYETFETVNYIPVAPITTTSTTTKVYYETITTGSSNYHPRRPVKHRPHQCRCLR
jgi:Ni/Co efflux regulator RcnB